MSRSKVGTLADDLEELGIDRDSVFVLVGTVNEWADLLAPGSAVTWNADEVAEAVKKLNALIVLEDEDFITADQIARYDAVKDIVKAPGGTGVRGPRTAPKPEDLTDGPEWVGIFLEDGTRIGTRNGNRDNSASNLKSGAKKVMVDAHIDFTKEDEAAILSAAKEVTEGRTTEASYGGFTFRVVAGKDED